MKIFKQQRFVSLALAGILIVIFTLYKTGIFTGLPCENNLITNASRDFIHVDLYHLLVNMAGLYYISSLETDIGALNYTIVVTSIVVISSITTWMVQKIFNPKCAIGFSGVLLGLMAFALLSQTEQLNWMPILYLIAASINPGSGNISVSGHLIGIFAGIVTFFIVKAVK